MRSKENIMNSVIFLSENEKYFDGLFFGGVYINVFFFVKVNEMLMLIVMLMQIFSAREYLFLVNVNNLFWLIYIINR